MAAAELGFKSHLFLRWRGEMVSGVGEEDEEQGRGRR